MKKGLFFILNQLNKPKTVRHGAVYCNPEVKLVQAANLPVRKNLSIWLWRTNTWLFAYITGWVRDMKRQIQCFCTDVNCLKDIQLGVTCACSMLCAKSEFK